MGGCKSNAFVMTKEQRQQNRMKAILEWNECRKDLGEKPMPKRVWGKAFD